MPIGGISLRNNPDCCKPQASKSQNFGKKDHDGEHKSHKAAYIAGSVGLLAAAVVTAYLFRSKIAELPIFKRTMEMGDDVLKKGKEFGEKAVEGTKDFAKEAVRRTKKMGQDVAEDTRKFAGKAKEGVNDALDKGKELVGDLKNAVTGKNPVKTAKSKILFTPEELAVLKQFKNKGSNQQGVFDTLKKYGMNESEEKYVKGTIDALRADFAKRGGTAKPISMRVFINEALKKDTPNQVIDELLTNSKNLRKKYNI